MKKIIFIGILIFMFVGCASSQNSITQAKTALEQVDSKKYTFHAITALPSGYPSVSLSYGYTLAISNDSVISFLPFYGRAYSAPYSSTDGGIKFTSTDYEYTVTPKKNSRNITIKTKDQTSNTTLYLSVQKSGSATLTVLDTNRQQIQFNGRIETE